MPRPIRTSKSVPRKRNSKLRTRRRKKVITSVDRPINVLRKSYPMAAVKKVTTTYFEKSITLNPASGGAPVLHSFNCNGMFDPDHTGTGHQPLGFDQLMAMYDHYVVVGSKITVNFSNNSSLASDRAIIGVITDDNNSIPGDVNQIIENGKGSYAYLQPLGSNNSSLSLSSTFSPKTALGVSHPMASENLRGDSSTNPTEGAYFNIWASAVNALDNPVGITCTVLIEYVAIFTEPRQLALS